MIMDLLENLKPYQRSVPELWEASQFIEKVKREQLPVGRYPLEKGFALVQEGSTVPFDSKDFETHDKYLDMQVLLSGDEFWEYAPKGILTPKTAYDPNADIEWLSGQGTRIAIRPDMFYIVYPWDGHKPCCHEGNVALDYRKVVIKIPVDKLIHRV